MTDLQRTFFDNQQRHKYNLFAGALGSSKTTGVTACVADELARYLRGELPPLKIALCHTNHQPAYDVLIEKLIGLNGATPRAVTMPSGEIVDMVRGRENQSKRKIYFGPHDREPCMIHWTGLDESSGLSDKFTLSGYEFDLIACTQAESLEESAFLAMRSRLGRRVIDGFLPRILLDCNPAPGWIKRIWVDGDHYKGDSADEYYVLNSRTEDNPHTSAAYKKSIAASPNQAYRSRYYLGNWDDIEGMVYEQFKRALSLVQFGEVPFEKFWRINVAMDWGHYPHPFAGLYYAADDAGNVWLLDEIEFYRHTAKQAATRIREKHERLVDDVKIVRGWAETPPKLFGMYYGPPDMQMTQADGKTRVDMMLSDPLDHTWRGIVVQTMSAGVPKSERDGAFINSLQELMLVDEKHRHPITGDIGAPRIYVTERCKRFLSQITTAQHDPDRPGKIKKTEQRNPFAETGDESAIHHWDIHDCGQLAAQEVRVRTRPTTAQQYEAGIYRPQARKKPNAVFYRE